MKKIDIAINSYKKPESLIYTLFSLKKHCGDLIDTIYIDDDISGDETVSLYKNEKLSAALSPIKLKIRVNKKRGGFGKTLYTRKMFFRLLSKLKIAEALKNLLSSSIYDENDIRYQWAINSTDKKCLFICHDDVRFTDNVIELFINNMNENTAIIGELGQCWRCAHSKICTPKKILNKNYPSEGWPLTPKLGREADFPYSYQRDCRINEWCCLLNVDIAKKLSEGSCYFGNCEDYGDTGAYYFGKIIEKGYEFFDPFVGNKSLSNFYQHQWQGHSGHSVWEDQGSGIAKYNKKEIIELLLEEFNYSIG